MKVYPTNFPGAFSIECSTGGHGRCTCTQDLCDCGCHRIYRGKQWTKLPSAPSSFLRFLNKEERK